MASMIPTVLLLLSSLFLSLKKSGAQTGVVYSTCGDNLPSAQEAVNLAKHFNIQMMRVFGPDESLFQALHGTNIELVLGVPNENLEKIACDQNTATSWVQNNVKNHHPYIKFRHIVVGNGVSPLNRDNAQCVQFLFPAMKNIQQAIFQAGLASNIKVTTAIDHHELVTENFHPSEAEFRPEIRSFLYPIINFLRTNNAPLLVNLHPYYSYANNRGEIPIDMNMHSTSDYRLEYATFRSQRTMVQDGQVQYMNAFDAMVDSVNHALEKAGSGSLDVVVSETGWPTAGGTGASKENAMAYNNNLIQHVNKYGTPKRPQKCVETYIFSMFDENQKSPEIEQNWGIFFSNQQDKYSINFFSGQTQK